MLAERAVRAAGNGRRDSNALGQKKGRRGRRALQLEKLSVCENQPLRLRREKVGLFGR
jgi:hypothetical protein